MLPENQIEATMKPALLGSEESARSFFRAFLDGPLFVPERYQSPALENSAPYPNDFVNIMGLQQNERVLVPVFSAEELIQAWCGKKLLCKKLSGRELLELTPVDWWICVNPGSEVEKEMSPWEIDQLKAGEEGIEAVVAEIYQPGPFDTLDIRPLKEGEYSRTLKDLCALAEDTPQIIRLFAAREEGQCAAGEITATLLIGAEVQAADSAALEEIRTGIQVVADKSQIGGEVVKVLAGAAPESLALGVFRQLPAFYARADRRSMSGLISRVWKSFTGRKTQSIRGQGSDS